MLDSIVSGLQASVEAVNRDLEGDELSADSQHKTPLEMYAFLLQWFSTAAERHLPKEGDIGVAVPNKSKV
jgi:condensin complex subunit 1